MADERTGVFIVNRALHCRGVALFMRDHAGMLGLDPGRAFLCGWLHDCGYAFSDNPGHATRGGIMLRDMGYTDWHTIARHGTPAGLETPLGRLLNIADMSVDSTGRMVGFASRLKDVEARYGHDSRQYRDCREMMRLMRDTREYKLIVKETDHGL